MVITDDNIIQRIEPFALLGKSDHVVLIIETNVFSQGSPLEQKLNYDKGDYEALRSCANCNWNKEFATVDLDVEALWKLLKDKIESGVKCCIPFTTRFQNTKWKRPLNEEIRDQIKSKKSPWRQYVRDKNSTTWLKYTKQRLRLTNEQRKMCTVIQGG